MTDYFGLVAGTVFYRQNYFAQAEKRVIETRFGPATVLLHDRWAYVPRHGFDDDNYQPPHKINHQANLTALKEIGVVEVIGINSCGSLRPSLEPGSVVLPSDYISLCAVPTVFEDTRGHIIPCLDEPLRSKLSQAAVKTGLHMVEGGIYWQNPGPRLETKAEIRMQSHYADMVGMTLASEASVAQELGLAYASLCSVDNYAHGLSHCPLSADEILDNASANSKRILEVLQVFLDIFG